MVGEEGVVEGDAAALLAWLLAWAWLLLLMGVSSSWSWSTSSPPASSRVRLRPAVEGPGAGLVTAASFALSLFLRATNALGISFLDVDEGVR